MMYIVKRQSEQNCYCKLNIATKLIGAGCTIWIGRAVKLNWYRLITDHAVIFKISVTL